MKYAKRLCYWRTWRAHVNGPNSGWAKTKGHFGQVNSSGRLGEQGGGQKFPEWRTHKTSQYWCWHFYGGSAARRQQERRIDRKSGLWALSGDCKRAQRAAVEAGVENKDQDKSTTAFTGLVFWVKPARILQRSRNGLAKPLWRSYRSIEQHKHTQRTAPDTAPVRVKEEQSKRKPSSLRVPPQKQKNVCRDSRWRLGQRGRRAAFKVTRWRENDFFYVGRWIFCVSFHEKVSPLSIVALSPVHPTGSKWHFKK